MMPRDPRDLLSAAHIGRAFERVSEALVAQGHVVIDGFGTFKLVRRKAHRARNPRTGDRVEVAARTVVRFTPSRMLKTRVAGITELPHD